MDTIRDVSQLKDFDVFFYYGYNDINIENKSDVLANIMQPKRSLFYDRSQDAAGAPGYENNPNGLNLKVNLAYDIVTSLAKRNQIVSNGDGDHPDRRIAVSQSTIRVETDKDFAKVSVLFIPLNDYRQTDSVSTLLNTNIT